jgi:hypothetical protein
VLTLVNPNSNLTRSKKFLVVPVLVGDSGVSIVSTLSVVVVVVVVGEEYALDLQHHDA